MGDEGEGQRGLSSMDFVGGADAPGGDGTLVGIPSEGRNYIALRSMVDRACSEIVQ